jgi:hypothetical protein
VETLGATSHQWFSEGMFQFAGTIVSKLPEDHHELCAMCASRALYVTANPNYIWLSNPSCYVNSRAVQQIYSTLGIPDGFGFSIVGGHLHCAVPSGQMSGIESFVEKLLLGNETVNTNIATAPYNIDLSPWITWTTPTLSNGTSLIEWTSLCYPSDLQTGLDTTITFCWNKVQDVTQYLIQVSSDSECTGLDKSDSTGVNDIGGLSSATAATSTANNLIAAYRQMIVKAHSENIRTYGGTILPFNGSYLQMLCNASSPQLREG